MSRKNMPVIIGGAVVGVIALVLAYFLYAAIQAYGNSSDELVDANGKLTRLQRRPVFPSRENAEAMEEQVVEYQEYLQGLSESLRQNQPSTADFSRDRFLSDYADTMRSLLNGRNKGVIITPPTGGSIPGMFGFELYRTGTPPNEKDLPRVMAQLQDIKAVCLALYDAGITEMLGVSRTEFETAAALANPSSDEDMGRNRRRRGREEEEPVAQPGALFTDPDGLFTRESYIFTFKASDAALQKVLDSLAAGQPFAVVTSLVVGNPTLPLIQPPPPPPGAAVEPQGGPVAASTISGFRAVGSATPPVAQKEAAPILPRELRVSAGQETPIISMNVDVYRFLDLASKQAEEEAE